MTLRSKIVIWFIALHAVMAVVAVFILLEKRTLLFAVEAFFVLSIIISYRLVSALFVPLDLIRTGAELIEERDFTSRFVAVGQPEMDRLIEIYNGMVDRLRDERLAAEEHHQLMLKIIQASPSGIAICDFDGNVQQVNPAAERLLGEPAVIEALPAMAAGESRLLTLRGNRRLKIWRAEFRDRGFGKSFYVLDEMTEELRLTEKSAYEKLIRMMSHEVNNSVGAVGSLLESLLRYANEVGEEHRADFTSALTVAAARMNSLNRFMADFADVVRIPQPNLREVDVAAIVEPIATLLRPELQQRNIELRLDLAKNGSIRADQHQLEQVVLNVLRNAAESIGEWGEIDVTWRDRVLTVADSGHGIDSRSQPELFTPFFTTKRDGRGLGLTIVQEILANHHARFSLQNRAERGAEFRIEFD
jgi:two-component system nitrogen regulation sensor histidine kinase NtrY